MALENLQLLEARQEEGYVTAVMLQVAQAVASQNNIQDILETIIHLMPILVGVDSCAIYLWDEKDQTFHPATAFSSIQGFKEKLLAVHYAAGEFPLFGQRPAQSQDGLLPAHLAGIFLLNIGKIWFVFPAWNRTR